MSGKRFLFAANLVADQPLPRRFYLWQCLLLALSGVLFYWLETGTSLDMQLAQLFFDPVTLGFPLQDNVWLERLNHQLLKYLVIAACLWLAVGAWRRRDARLGFTLLVMLCAAVTVSLLKAASAHSCPWELTVFGGTAEVFPLFSAPGPNPGEGRCFPGGHASSGFVLMGLFFYYAAARPRLARGMLLSGMALGMLMGFGQMVRGAHFLSHNLWSGWVVWLVCVLLFALYDGARPHYKKVSHRLMELSIF